MPLVVVAGPAHHWMTDYPLFFLTVVAYMYACYFTVRRLKLPKLILSHSYTRIGLTVAALLLCTYLLTLYPLPEMDFVTPSMSRYQTLVRNYNMTVSLWFMFSVTACYALTVSFVKELYERRLLQNIAECQRNKAELAVFKAQISPHFLFNTLNSLYSLVIGTSQKAEDAIIKFAELLKYTYVTIENEHVTLAEELAYIRNYIDLQLIRLDSHTRVDWRSDVDNPEALIPPMIFLTFVENAFKYGSSTTHDCEIRIYLRLERGQLLFETSNSVSRHKQEFRQEMPVGLENCKSRQAGLFPGRHSLMTHERNGRFEVELRINLNDK